MTAVTAGDRAGYDKALADVRTELSVLRWIATFNTGVGLLILARVWFS